MSLFTAIKNNKTILVFGKKICPNCKKLKSILEHVSVEFDTILIEDYMEKYDDDDLIFDELEYLKQKFNIKSYPFIFIKSEFDGGYDKYKKMNDIGVLENYLKSKEISFIEKNTDDLDKDDDF